MRKVSNDKDLIIISRAELEAKLKAEFERGVASVAKETVSKAKSKTATAKGTAEIRKAVVEDIETEKEEKADEQHTEVSE